MAEEEGIDPAERAGAHHALHQGPAPAPREAEAKRGRGEDADPGQEAAPEGAEQEPRGVDHRERRERGQDRLNLDQDEGDGGRPRAESPKVLADARQVPGDHETPGLPDPDKPGRERRPDVPGAQEREPDEANHQHGQHEAQTHPGMLPLPRWPPSAEADTLTAPHRCGQIGASDSPHSPQLSEEAAAWKP